MSAPGNLGIPAGAARVVRALRSRLCGPLTGLVFVVLLANAILLGSVAVHLQHMHDTELADARRTAQNTARLLENDLDNLLSNVDTALQEVADEFLDQQARGPQTMLAWLEQVRARSPDIRTLMVSDAAGNLSGDGVAPGPVNVADRPYFAVLRDDPAAGLQLSPPLLGRIDKTNIVVAARRIRDPGGEFVGSVSAALPLMRFGRTAAGLVLEGRDRVAVWDRHGELLASVPTPAGQGEAARRMPTLDGGRDQAVQALAPPGEAPTLRAYHRNARYGFTVFVDAVPPRSVWASTRAAVAGVGYLLFAAGSAFFTLRTVQWRRDQLRHARIVETGRAHFTAFFDHALIGMATLTPTGHWRTVNAALLEIIGQSREDLLGRSLTEIGSTLGPASEVNALLRVVEGASDSHCADLRITRTDGARLALIVSLRAVRRPHQEEDFLALCVQDISAREAAEARAREATALARGFIDHFPGAAYVKGEDGRLLMVSREAGRIFGAEQSDLVGKKTEDLLPGAYEDEMDAADRRVLATGVSERLVRPLGRKVLSNHKFVVAGLEGRRLVGGFVLDVTAAKREEDRLLGLLFINALASSLDERQLIVHGLDVARRLTGSAHAWLQFVVDDAPGAATECIGTHGCGPSGSQSGPGEAQAGTPAMWARCLAALDQVVIERVQDAGTARSFQVAVPLVEEARLQAVIGVDGMAACEPLDLHTLQLVGHDLWRIVRRNRAEQALQDRLAELQVLNRQLQEAQSQLLQSEKMASIGQLAAGVAHELNNPISFVQSNLGTLAGYVDDLFAVLDHCTGALANGADRASADRLAELMREKDFEFVVQDLRQLLAESVDGADRVRRIVRNLKEFSHVSEDEWRWSDLHQGLDSTIAIVWNEIKYKAELRKQYGELPPVWCMPAHLNQVFMNVLVNAAQAIEVSGAITLRTGATPSEVWIEIEDTGKGIAPEHLAKIFDPFFTTKPVGQGTGLGLSLAYTIVKKHGGQLAVRSAPGVGSCFRVTLPRCNERQAPEATASLSLQPA